MNDLAVRIGGAALLLLATASCDLAASAPKTPKTAIVAGSASIEATLQLPSGDGRVHVIAVPTDYMEITRCIVAVGPNGAASVACAPKGIDLPPEDSP